MNTSPSYLQSGTRETSSASTGTLFSYFLPELITVAILYIGLEIINFRFLACTDQALCNATFFISNSLFHLITKLAEGFSIGLVILCGNAHGQGSHQKTGKLLTDAFWITSAIGAFVAIAVYFGAEALFTFFEAPQEVVSLGVPYIQVRAISIFLAFIFFAMIGFFRAIKNPRLTMSLFVLGAMTYLLFDYALIFGAWGFPALGLKGSAWATVIQYFVMLTGALLYLLLHSDMRKYELQFFSRISVKTITHLVSVSWPVTLDKASLALCPIWLNKMIGCTAKLIPATDGQLMYDSLTVLKTMERVGVLPALAFAQVITYVVSNDIKTHSFRQVKNSIKKVLYISCTLVGLATLIFCLKPHFFLALLNKHTAYNDLIAHTLPFVSLLIIFDVVQLILSAALRGAADVKTVMIARLMCTVLFFFPAAYGITLLSLENHLVTFLLLYSTIHLSYALMGFIYISRFKLSTRQ